jgi:hypothetical protein
MTGGLQEGASAYYRERASEEREPVRTSERESQCALARERASAH